MLINKTLNVWPLAKRGTFRKPQAQYKENKGIGNPVVYGIIKPGELEQPYEDELDKKVLYALTLGKLYCGDSPFYRKTVVCINKDFPGIDEIIASVVPERTRYREQCLQLFEYKGETCYVFQVKDLSITTNNIVSELLDTIGDFKIPNVKNGRVHRLHDVIVNTEDKYWYWANGKVFEALSNNGIHIVNCKLEPDEKSCARILPNGFGSDYLNYCAINKVCHPIRLSYSLSLLTHNIYFKLGRGPSGHSPEPYVNRYSTIVDILNGKARGINLSELIFLSYYKAVMEKSELYKAFIKSLIRKEYRENFDMKWFMQAMEHYVDNPLEPLPESFYEEAECIDKANSYGR